MKELMHAFKKDILLNEDKFSGFFVSTNKQCSFLGLKQLSRPKLIRGYVCFEVREVKFRNDFYRGDPLRSTDYD